MVAGGPFIVDDFFYSAFHKRDVPSTQIGTFFLKTGKFLEPVKLLGRDGAPHALVMDRAGNFHVMQTDGQLKKYSPKGKNMASGFRAGFRAIYEGFYLDKDARVMTVSITSRDGSIHIARIKLRQD